MIGLKFSVIIMAFLLSSSQKKIFKIELSKISIITSFNSPLKNYQKVASVEEKIIFIM